MEQVFLTIREDPSPIEEKSQWFLRLEGSNRSPYSMRAILEIYCWMTPNQTWRHPLKPSYSRRKKARRADRGNKGNSWWACQGRRVQLSKKILCEVDSRRERLVDDDDRKADKASQGRASSHHLLCRRCPRGESVAWWCTGGDVSHFKLHHTRYPHW